MRLRSYSLHTCYMSSSPPGLLTRKSKKAPLKTMPKRYYLVLVGLHNWTASKTKLLRICLETGLKTAPNRRQEAARSCLVRLVGIEPTESLLPKSSGFTCLPISARDKQLALLDSNERCELSISGLGWIRTNARPIRSRKLCPLSYKTKASQVWSLERHTRERKFEQ